jgi:hypothetical protein
VIYFKADAWEWPPETTLTDDRLRVRRVTTQDRREVLSGRDADDKRHILIRIADNEGAAAAVSTRGMAVSVRNLSQPGQDPGRYIDIVCHDTGGHAAFHLIGDEIASALSDGAPAPCDVVDRVISRWRQFWGRLPQSILSRSEQIGLFAELWFLLTWLGSEDVAMALSRWRGPTGSRHDFEWQGYSVEVKATISVHHLVHRVNGVDQLVPPESGSLLLFSLQVRQEEGAANSLPIVVGMLRSRIAGNPDAALDLEDKLARIGYSSTHDPEYGRLRLRVGSEGLYRVDHDFPRITPLSFREGVPNGVGKIEYDVTLNGFDHLRVASRPSEMPSM